ncbi:hypothetical protein EQH57_0625 [Dictyocoela roeselum]|nr:hypothetical protein EQH57_0625 [Dictyocoela roeselum]
MNVRNPLQLVLISQHTRANNLFPKPFSACIAFDCDQVFLQPIDVEVGIIYASVSYHIIVLKLQIAENILVAAFTNKRIHPVCQETQNKTQKEDQDNQSPLLPPRTLLFIIHAPASKDKRWDKNAKNRKYVCPKTFRLRFWFGILLFQICSAATS